MTDSSYLSVSAKPLIESTFGDLPPESDPGCGCPDASESVSGLVTTGEQNFGGAKTFYLSSGDKVVVDPSQVGAVYVHGDRNEAISYYVHNTNAGSAARAIISFGNDQGINLFSIANTSTGYTTHPFANSAVWSFHGAVRSVLRNTDSSAPFYFVLGTGGDPSFELRGTTGALRSWGVQATDYTDINGGSSVWLNTSKSVAGGVAATIKNSSSSASAYNEIRMQGNAGEVDIGHTSSAYSNSIMETDQAYILANNSHGLMLGTVNGSGPVKIKVNGSGTASFTVKQSGVVNIPLTNYADNAAAVSAGLVAGDLYQTSGTVKVVTA